MEKTKLFNLLFQYIKSKKANMLHNWSENALPINICSSNAIYIYVKLNFEIHEMDHYSNMYDSLLKSWK